MKYALFFPKNGKEAFLHFLDYVALRFKKMLGCFNPILGQIWTTPAIWLHF